MDIKKKIKHRYHFKYFILVCLLLLYVPLIGIILTQFIKKELFIICFIVFIFVLIFDMLLSYIYYKKFKLPDINTTETLNEYLKYFSSGKMSDLEYTESITWFSHLIKSEFIKKGNDRDILGKTVNKLYLVLRPNDNDLCDALKRKTAFISISAKLLNNEDASKDILNFKNLDIEKYNYISFLLDKNILIYALFFPIHIFACFLITKGSCPQFNPNIFFGNLLLYIPADMLVILIYKGIVKNIQS